MISKLQYAINYCSMACLPRPTGVSSCVFVPHNLEEYKPITLMGEACMAFMNYPPGERYSKFIYKSVKKGGGVRERFEEGDWMFYMSPCDRKIKKDHLAYVEWIMGNESKALSNQDKPDSWAVVNDEVNNSILVFVHNNLEFRPKSMFFINTLLRALWEYPSYVDKWVELVNAGVDKDEALYFMWYRQEGSPGRYSYGFQIGGHCPFGSSINLDKFLEGTPVVKYNNLSFSKDGWETGINEMWGTTHSYLSILNIKVERYIGICDKDLITLIRERNK